MYPTQNNNYPPHQFQSPGFQAPVSAPYPTLPRPDQQQSPYGNASPYPNVSAYPGQYPPTGLPAAYPLTQNQCAVPGQYPQGYPGSAQGQYPQAYPGSAQGQYPQAYPDQQQLPFNAQAQNSPHPNQLLAQSAMMQPFVPIPTIKEGKFDPEMDAKVLRKAMKGFGTDEAAIINVLTRRTNAQRLQISQAYMTLYSKDLVDDLKSETSGNFKSTLVALMTPRFDFLAKTVYEAIAGAGTRDHVLMDVICTASGPEILAIKDAYQKLYTTPMEKDIGGDTSGYFERVLLAICRGDRDENPMVDFNMAEQDARSLMNAGVKKIGTDEAEFIRILTTRSYPQLRAVFEKYQAITGKDIEKSIKAEFSGNIKDALLTIITCAKNRPQYFAERLRSAMKGLGTKDDRLIFILVTRADVDLENIKIEFNKRYTKTLPDNIKSETSGDYKKALVALCG